MGQFTKIGQTHLNAKLNSLAELIEEIKAEDYQTINQVIGHIHNSIEILAKIKKDKGYE